MNNKKQNIDQFIFLMCQVEEAFTYFWTWQKPTNWQEKETAKYTERPGYLKKKFFEGMCRN